MLRCVDSVATELQDFVFPLHLCGVPGCTQSPETSCVSSALIILTVEFRLDICSELQICFLFSGVSRG